jgi:multidrug transporter EmrE-like cation transporter
MAQIDSPELYRKAKPPDFKQSTAQRVLDKIGPANGKENIMIQRIRFSNPPLPQGNILLIGGLVLMNMIFNVLGNSCFKLSALAPNWKGLVGWQVVGNLAGLVTVLTLTGLLKYLPLHVAQPMVQGISIIAVQIMAARLFFHETISPTQWLGMLAIVAGIVLIQK